MFLLQNKPGDGKGVIYVLTILLLPIAYTIGQLPFQLVTSYKVDNDPEVSNEDIDAFNSSADFSLLNMDSNLGLVLLISVFVGVWLLLFLSLRYFHRRPFRSIITSGKSINYGKILWGFVVWLALSSVLEGLVYFSDPESYMWNFDWGNFWILLLICIFILPIQTTAEELFFRGYFMQGLTSYLRKPWLALIISSILFGAIHLQNPEIYKYGVIPMQMYYVSAGLLLGLMTVFDDGLELAIGVHWATNFFGAVCLSYEGSVLQTDSILKGSEVNAWLGTILFILAGVMFLMLAGRKYNWGPFYTWTKKLDNITTHEEFNNS